MFDGLIKFMMGLIMVWMITYVGVVVMAQMANVESQQQIVVTAPATVATAATVATTIPTTVPTTVPTPDPIVATPPPDTATVSDTMSDAVGWVSIIVVAGVAVMTLGMLFRVFGDDSYSSPTPKATAPKPVKPTVKPTGPTTTEQIEADPEIQWLRQDLAAFDADVAEAKEERRQYVASLPWSKRARRWLSRRGTTEEPA